MATRAVATTDWWEAHIHPVLEVFVEQMKPDRVLKVFLNQKVISNATYQEVKAGWSPERCNELLLLALRGKDHHVMSLFRRALAETKQMRLSQYLEFSECGVAYCQSCDDLTQGSVFCLKYQQAQLMTEGVKRTGNNNNNNNKNKQQTTAETTT